MLFYRGYPKDAVRMFRRALDEDSKMYEAWFRIGLVEHREGNHDNAEVAYRKCLKLLTGHGWCNFYMGLLCEQTGRPSKALHHYRRAFKFAPELSDPAVNPELLASELPLGAIIQHRERQRFTNTLPMPFLEAEQVDKVRKRFEHEFGTRASDEQPEKPESPPPTVKTVTKKPTARTAGPRAAKSPRPRRPVPRVRGGAEAEAAPSPEVKPTPAPTEEGGKILPRVPSVSREALLPPLNDPFRRG
jgi:tetratricopeptide (TPR) repeat protein